MTGWEAFGDAVLSLAEGAADEAVADGLALHVAEDGQLDPFGWVCATLGLDADEAAVLALLLAVELDPTRQRRVDALQGTTHGSVTLRLLGRLFPAPHRGVRAVGPDAPLLRAALLDVADSGPWGARAVRVEQALVWSVLGDTSLDPALAVGTRVATGGWTAPEPGLRVVCGGDAESRRQALLTDGAGTGLLVVPAGADQQQWAAAVRQATLDALMPVVELDGEVPPLVRHWVERGAHLPWGLCSQDELPLDQLPSVPWRERRLQPVPTGARDWEAYGLPALPGHVLDPEQLRLVAFAHEGQQLDDRQVRAEAAVRRLAAGHLDRLTRRIRPRRGWDDLVLPPDLLAAVRALADRHRHRVRVFDEWGFDPGASRGTVALMSGPSGTGKTLTAEVVAHELGLDLFVLDLSTVVSKYIGETEKNLGAVFDAAAQSDSVLFFDEADALFGRRSAVTDAKDRYANLEVSYLLQRLERHDGLVLLATNLPSNIDEAFTRRFHAHLQFAVPGVDERRLLWQRAFPAQCPTGELDVDLLARSAELTGGPIASAALAAAFQAAADGEPLGTASVLQAVQAEYRKQGRLLEVVSPR